MYGFNGKPQPIGNYFSNIRKDGQSNAFIKELRNLGIDPAIKQNDLWKIYTYAEANLAGKTQEPVNPEFEKVLNVLNKYYDSWN